jgi:hypothetical protein
MQRAEPIVRRMAFLEIHVQRCRTLVAVARGLFCDYRNIEKR